MSADQSEDYGVLVGWTSQQVGDRLTLRMQCVTKPGPAKHEDMRSHFYLMDRQQAVQLGNYLFEITGETKPGKRSGWLARLLG